MPVAAAKPAPGRAETLYRLTTKLALHTELWFAWDQDTRELSDKHTAVLEHLVEKAQSATKIPGQLASVKGMEPYSMKSRFAALAGGDEDLAKIIESECKQCIASICKGLVADIEERLQHPIEDYDRGFKSERTMRELLDQLDDMIDDAEPDFKRAQHSDPRGILRALRASAKQEYCAELEEKIDLLQKENAKVALEVADARKTMEDGRAEVKDKTGDLEGAYANVQDPLWREVPMIILQGLGQ
eukprot:Clim_evm2s39 gene=Clim_evmTU2s39